MNTEESEQCGKDGVERAISALMHWVERVKYETEHTKVKMLEAMSKLTDKEKKKIDGTGENLHTSKCVYCIVLRQQS